MNVGAGVEPPGTAAEPLGAGEIAGLADGLELGAAGEADTGGGESPDAGATEPLGCADGLGDDCQLAISIPKTMRTAIAPRRIRVSPTRRRRRVVSISRLAYATRPAA